MPDDSLWPALTAEIRPWTRWWWLGSALTEAEITRHLTLFQEAGFGGVEVSPIYGVEGYEDRWVEFLSPRWVELFAHTLKEADRLGMGVDLITGTGWPFGGPWVSDADAARVAWVETLQTGERTSRKKPGAIPIGESDALPDGSRHVFFIAPTGQQVKRAAPGGAGNVLDHFNSESVRRYIAPFDAMLERLPDGLRPRCVFNDSWEVYGANATPDILDQFSRRRGYDLRNYLGELKGDGDPDTVSRVRSDYRQTVFDLTSESFLGVWAGWARERGIKSRNQAHGSPGNLLDLYAQADIPETEMFGPLNWQLGGEPPLSELPHAVGNGEELLMCKMASSAAHVTGKPLCSSESFTWLGEHGQVSLAQMKAEVDALFTCGINHIFFHGTPFSPEDVPWPGWLFYASTNVAPTNPLWRDLATLNQYITRVQSFLQMGVPDNDLLVYFPYHDLLASNTGTRDYLHFLTVHRTDIWLRDNLFWFVQVTRDIERAYGFLCSYDLVSDQQLRENVTVSADGLTTTGGATYEALLIAGCNLMPPETLERIADLAQAGAKVIFTDSLPNDVPGLTALKNRRERLAAARDSLQGQVTVVTSEFTLTHKTGIKGELDAYGNYLALRRRLPDGQRFYFVTWPAGHDSPNASEDMMGLYLKYPSEWMWVINPMTGKIVKEKMWRETITGMASPGTSLFLIPAHEGSEPDFSAFHWLAQSDKKPERGWRSTFIEGGPLDIELNGEWRVEFIEGGPTLPAPRTVAALTDWTQWGDTELVAFSGTARYTLTFDAPVEPNKTGWRIELGKVCDSARVRLNGVDLGSVIAPPWWVDVPDALWQPTGNVLEIEVTNLMANRLADLERREGAAWRPFLMVNIHYKPFDAASWQPTPSGLLGPVRLVALEVNQE